MMGVTLLIALAATVPASSHSVHSIPSTMEERLFEYVAGRHHQKLWRLLHSAPSLVDTVRPGSNGFTPLHVAASKGDAQLAWVLLAHSASLTAVTDMGMTPLMLAASRGDTPDVVALLLDHIGSSDRAVLDLQEPNLGWSALFMAAFSGDEQSVTALLTSGANATLTGRDSYSESTAADVALEGGHAAISATISEAQRRHAVADMVSEAIIGPPMFRLLSTFILLILVGGSVCLRGASQEHAFMRPWIKEAGKQRRQRQRELQQRQQTQLRDASPKSLQQFITKGRIQREPHAAAGNSNDDAAPPVHPTLAHEDGQPFCARTPCASQVIPILAAVSLHDAPADEECVVCMDGARTHAFVPCGHRMVCEECAMRVLRSTDPACPSCRSACTQALRVYV